VSTFVDRWHTGSALDTPLGGTVRSPVARRSWRLGALLAGPPSSSSSASVDGWLIQLRWLALVGMTATVVGARVLVPALVVTPLLLVLSAILLVNLGWMAAMRRTAGEVAQRRVAHQITVDAALLGALLWWSGGLHNPFAVFLAFQIVLAGFLCSSRTAVRIALVTVAVAALLCWAPSLPLDSAPLGRDRLEVLGALGALASLIWFLGFVSVVYRTRLEELRREGARNEKLAMLGRLVGGMSHELSTPLATILLGSNELVDMIRSGDAEAVTMARTIAAEAHRASDIVGLLRGHIRPDQRASNVNLSDLVPAYAAKELDRLGFNGERVFIAPAPVLATVLEVGLCQVLTNLLSNAVQAASPEGHVARRLEIAVIARGKWIEVSVTDDGPGFSDEIVERLGEPFHTTKEDQGGMGLGLYVSSVIAKRMNAALRIENAVEGGARVTLLLPVAEADAKGEVRS
jgi:two-component system, sensor histidine kinase RegB